MAAAAVGLVAAGAVAVELVVAELVVVELVVVGTVAVDVVVVVRVAVYHVVESVGAAVVAVVPVERPEDVDRGVVAGDGVSIVVVEVLVVVVVCVAVKALPPWHPIAWKVMVMACVQVEGLHSLHRRYRHTAPHWYAIVAVSVSFLIPHQCRHLVPHFHRTLVRQTFSRHNTVYKKFNEKLAKTRSTKFYL